MPSSRLYQQFQRLAQQLGCDEREASLAEVADLLCCTPRNARLLLRRMRDGLPVGGPMAGRPWCAITRCATARPKRTATWSPWAWRPPAAADRFVAEECARLAADHREKRWHRGQWVYSSSLH